MIMPGDSQIGILVFVLFFLGVCAIGFLIKSPRDKKVIPPAAIFIGAFVITLIFSLVSGFLYSYVDTLSDEYPIVSFIIIIGAVVFAWWHWKKYGQMPLG